MSAPAWLDVRRKVVGGSDVPHLFDEHLDESWLSRWGLWMDKAGRMPARETNERMRWGNRLESAVIAGVREEWHLDAIGWGDFELAGTLPTDVQLVQADKNGKPSPVLVHTAGVGGTPDGLIRTSSGVVLLECKTVDRWSFDAWDMELSAPYFLQVQTYLGLLGLPRAVVAVLVGGNRLERFDVEADPETFAGILAEAQRFWASVREDAPPPVRPVADADAVDRWFKRAGVYGQRVDLTETPGAVEVLARFEATKQAEAAAKDESKAARAALELLIGSAEGAVIGSRIVSAPTIKAHPGKLITQDDVGTRTGAREPYRRISIAEAKAS